MSYLLLGAVCFLALGGVACVVVAVWWFQRRRTFSEEPAPGPEPVNLAVAQTLAQFLCESDPARLPELPDDAAKALVSRLGQVFQARDYVEVVRQADQALGSAGPELKLALLNQKGGALYARRQYAAALLAYQAACAAAPEERSLLGNVAEALAKLGRDAELLALVERWEAMGGQPKERKAYNDLKRALQSLAGE